MREEHPVFSEKAATDTQVWRYYNFPKFVDLLRTGALYFSRADLLGDPLEGSFPKSREIARQKALERPPKGRTREKQEKIFRHNQWVTSSHREAIFVNCWHMGHHESMAMWRGYGEGPYGVAIQSDYGTLDAVLPEEMEPRTIPEVKKNIYIGLVRYIDFSSDTVRIDNDNNGFAPFLYKSVVYSHEQEVRAIFWSPENPRDDDKVSGHLVQVDLCRLVKKVVVSPLAPAWFPNVVQGVCRQFGFPFPVVLSVVSVDPIY